MTEPKDDVLPESEVVMVFKHLDATKDKVLLDRYIGDGWQLLSENEDRFYFQRGS